MIKERNYLFDNIKGNFDLFRRDRALFQGKPRHLRRILVRAA